jgi:hypothetical protein
MSCSRATGKAAPDERDQPVASETAARVVPGRHAYNDAEESPRP